MTEKTIQPRSTSQFPNLIYTPDLTLATVNDLTYLQGASNINTPADYDIAAVGTITMVGVASADETFIIDDEIFTWKAARTIAFEVTIGANATAACTNLIAAINADMTSVDASQGAGTTVLVTAYWYGAGENENTFSENCTNMTMDGSGFMGGTVAGDDKYEELEHLDITGQGYATIFTASDIYWVSWYIVDNSELAIHYHIELYDNTALTSVISFNMWVFSVYMNNGYVLPGMGFTPYVRTINTLIDGHSYTWSMSWKKHRRTTSTVSAISQFRILTIQEIKR